MRRTHERLYLRRLISLLKKRELYRLSQIRPVLHVIFRLFCWSSVAWLVWNHALMDFLNADKITVPQSVGIGALLCVLSMVLEEDDSGWNGEAPTRHLR
jgi:hypothetical protein